jgi:hypothetical protein
MFTFILFDQRKFNLFVPVFPVRLQLRKAPFSKGLNQNTGQTLERYVSDGAKYTLLAGAGKFSNYYKFQVLNL